MTNTAPYAPRLAILPDDKPRGHNADSKPAAQETDGKARVLIHIASHRHGIRATVEGYPSCWGQGDNRYEALGHLLFDHPEMFGAKITKKA